MTSSIFRPKSFLPLAVLLALGLSLSGCTQFVLLSYLLHGPPTIEPDFDGETKLSLSKPDTVVAVVGYAPTEVQWKFPRIDDQVATAVAYRLGQNHIKMIDPAYVKSWIDQHPDWEQSAEIGKAFNADYVIEIEIAAYSLYEGTSTTLFRGRTEANVHVVKMSKEEGTGERIYSKALNFEYPTQIPRSSYEQSLQDFQKEYLSTLSQKIGYLFYERSHGDMIGWAN